MFDPYREWLGITDGPRPPDHYTLLGLAPLEGDPAVIGYAADMVLAKIRRIRPGENVAEWGKLLDLLTTAKNCLLDAAAKRAYDEGLMSGKQQPLGATMARKGPPMAVPPALTSQTTQPSQDDRPRVPFPVGYGQQSAVPSGPAALAAPPAAQPELVADPGPTRDSWGLALGPPPLGGEVAMPWPGGANRGEFPAVAAIPAAPVASPRGGSGPLIAVLLLVIVALSGGLALVLLNPQWRQTAMVAPDGNPPVSDKPRMASSADANLKKPKKPKVTPQKVAPASKTEDAARNEADAGSTIETPEATATDSSEPESPAAPPSDRPLEATPASAPSQPGNLMAETPGDLVTKTPGDLVAKTPADPVPEKPAEKPAEPKPADDPVKHEAFKKAVADARLAMSQRDLPRAKQSIKTALANVQTDAEDEQAARIDAIEQNLEEFWKAVARAISTLPPATEFAYKDTRVIVVEASRTNLTIKAGKMHRYKIDEIPTPLLVAISNDLIVQDAGWKMLMGTFLAMDANGDRAAAKSLWQAAAKGGAPIDDILPELGLAPTGKKRPAPSAGKAADNAASSEAAIEALKQQAKAAKSKREHGEVAKEALKQLVVAANASNWQEAEQLLEIARTAARKAENIAISRQVTVAAQQLQAAKSN